MIYRVTKNVIFQNLSYTFFAIGVAVLFGVLQEYKILLFDMRIIYFITAIVLLIALLQLFDYLKYLTKGEIKIDPEGIRILDRNLEKFIPKEDIVGVTVYGAPSIKRKSMFRLLPFEAFHYVDIECKSGENIIITSLSDYYLYWDICKEKIFNDKLQFNKGSLTSRGNMINSIFWNRMEG